MTELSPPTRTSLTAAPPAASLRHDERRVYVVPIDEPDAHSDYVDPVGVYATIDAARAARDTRSDTSGIAVGLAIGLSVVAVVGLGITLCYVLFRKDKGLEGPVTVPQPMPMPYPYPIPQLAAPPVSATPIREPTADDVLEFFKKHKLKK